MYFRFFAGGPSGELKEPVGAGLTEDLDPLRDGRPESECRALGAICEPAFGPVDVDRRGW